MSTFKVGDVVRIINDNHYSITRIGSWGIVEKVDTRIKQVEVNFMYTPTNILDTYVIAMSDLELMERKSKEELVLDKVRLIHSRQLKRGIIHV